jgi:hypothetical protein
VSVELARRLPRITARVRRTQQDEKEEAITRLIRAIRRQLVDSPHDRERRAGPGTPR